MKIRYFAWIKNITNKNSELIKDNNVKDITSLKIFLSKKYPKLKSYLLKKNIIFFAINLKHTSKNKKINPKDDIAVYPPVSGG